MSKNKELEVRDIIQSIGNSWVVCKSKSRKGCIFYFNTETGEAVWNLSDAEIEKAKKLKLELNTHNSGKSPRNPQHSDKPPPDSSVAPPSGAPRLVSQTNNHINNHISSQQISNIPFQGFVTNNTSFSGPVGNCTSLSSLNQYQINPNNVISSLTNVLSLDNNQQSVCTPNVWALPQQQIFITPLVNQTQASPSIGYNSTLRPLLVEEHPAPEVYALNAVQYFTSPETTVAESTQSFTSRRRFNTRQYKLTRNVQNNDLRQKLTAQRTNRRGGSLHARLGVCKFGRNKLQRNHGSASAGQSVVAADVSQQNRHEETPPEFDLTALESAAARGAGAWRLVPDADVLLAEFKFITARTVPDGRCRLVVPRHVLAQVARRASHSGDTRARCVLRSLTTQIRHGDVTLGETSEPEGDTDEEDLMLSTCFKLYEEKYHTILLTNNSKILMNKDSVPFSIFTPEEVKIFLKGNQYKNTSKAKPSTFIPKRLAHTNHNKSQLDENTCIDKNKKNNVLRDASVMTSNEEFVSFKKTMDAEIQTDFSLNNMLGSSNNVDDKSKTQESDSIVKNIDKYLNASTSHDTVVKSRKIKLKRSVPTQLVPDTSKSNEKRNFKWHRRRNDRSQVDKIGSDNNSAKNEGKTESQESEITSETGKNSRVHDKTFSETNLDIANSDGSVAHNCNETIIEKTSTSDLISSNNSNKANENNDNGVQTLETLLDTQLEPVLYKVDSPGMAECLKVKCDEWVSRFIQIMEEVLSVVLQHDPFYSYNGLPPPWTIHEAAQCIKLKFNSSTAARAAADNFSRVLFRVSDGQGKIYENIKPSEYMEMYSYGVNLLNTLQGLVNDCEDLQIATESLKKLLVDIQNSNTCSMNESSAEISHDSNLQISSITPEKQSPYKKKDDYDKREESYNLRSTQSNNLKRPVPFVRNLDTKISFFKILHLKENNDIDYFTNESKRMKILDEDSNAEKNNFDSLEDTHNMNTVNEHEKNSSISIEEDDSSIEPVSDKIDSAQFNKKGNLDQSLDGKKLNKLDETNIDIDIKCSKDSTETKNDSPKSCTDNYTTVNEPKIIRNFSKCAVFEEKLKNKLEENLFDDDSVLDYEEDYQYITEGYDFPDEVDEYEKEKEIDDTIDDEHLKMNLTKETETLCYNENYEKLKFVIGKILQQIKEAFLSVQTLCEKYFEEIEKPFVSNVKKVELQVKAENAQSYIANLCNSLDRMLMREAGEPNNNIEALWKKSGDAEFRIDKKCKIKYSKIIAECKCHAEVFLESIRHIISALKY